MFLTNTRVGNEAAFGSQEPAKSAHPCVYVHKIKKGWPMLMWGAQHRSNNRPKRYIPKSKYLNPMIIPGPYREICVY